MEAVGVQKPHEPSPGSPTPILYVGLAANVLGRVPFKLMPLFLLGNFTLTVPHQLRQHQSGKFPYGLADRARIEATSTR